MSGFELDYGQRARRQAAVDEMLSRVRSTQWQNDELAAALDGLRGWLDSDVEEFVKGFRANRSFVDALEEVETVRRALRNLERIAQMWSAR